MHSVHVFHAKFNSDVMLLMVMVSLTLHHGTIFGTQIKRFSYQKTYDALLCHYLAITSPLLLLRNSQFHY